MFSVGSAHLTSVTNSFSALQPYGRHAFMVRSAPFRAWTGAHNYEEIYPSGYIHLIH